MGWGRPSIKCNYNWGESDHVGVQGEKKKITRDVKWIKKETCRVGVQIPVLMLMFKGKIHPIQVLSIHWDQQPSQTPWLIKHSQTSYFRSDNFIHYFTPSFRHLLKDLHATHIYLISIGILFPQERWHSAHLQAFNLTLALTHVCLRVCLYASACVWSNIITSWLTPLFTPLRLLSHTFSVHLVTSNTSSLCLRFLCSICHAVNFNYFNLWGNHKQEIMTDHLLIRVLHYHWPVIPKGNPWIWPKSLLSFDV